MMLCNLMSHATRLGRSVSFFALQLLRLRLRWKVCCSSTLALDSHHPCSFCALSALSLSSGAERSILETMPQETLTFPPLYCIVGAYRLLHDPSLYQPMWAKCSQAAKRASVVAAIWAVCTWPFQRLFVYYFMSASASVTGLGALYRRVVQTADVTDDNLPFRIPVPSLQSKLQCRQPPPHLAAS